MSAETTINNIIDAQVDRATESTQKAVEYSDAAQTAAGVVVTLTDPNEVPVPEIEIPDPTNLTSEGVQDFSKQFIDAYDAAKNNYDPTFANNWTTFIDTFFPDIDGCLRDNADDWLCNTIANGGTGIPACVENQIYDRGRERQMEIYRGEAETALTEWAARGYTLPPGVLLDRMQRAEARMNDEVSKLNRDVAIKNIEIEIENIRFAVQQANQLRTAAINSALDYLRTYFQSSPRTAIDYAQGVTQAKASFYNSTQQYYGAIVAAARVALEAEIYNSQIRQKSNEVFASLVNTNTAARVEAAVKSADTLARLGAASSAALNTLVNLGNITTQST